MANLLPKGKQGVYNLTTQTSFLRQDITFLDGLTSSLGAIPEGAIVLRGYVVVKEAFDAGTGGIGTEDSPDLFGEINLATIGRSDLTIPASGSWDDEEVEFLLTRSTESTVGKAAIIIEFIQKR